MLILFLALLLSGLMLVLALTSGPAPRLASARLRPVLGAMVKALAVVVVLSGLIGFAEAMRQRDAPALATQREARLRLANSPNDPDRWKKQLAEGEARYAEVQSKGPDTGLIWDIASRVCGVGMVLIALGAAAVVFRKRLDP